MSTLEFHNVLPTPTFRIEVFSKLAILSTNAYMGKEQNKFSDAYSTVLNRHVLRNILVKMGISTKQNLKVFGAI